MTDMTNNRMDLRRAEIDEIDATLLELLNRRVRVVAEIGTIKKTTNTPVFDPSREQAVLHRLRTSNPGPLDAPGITRIFRRIIRESRRIEEQVWRTEDRP